jgi:hypothetical protein
MFEDRLFKEVKLTPYAFADDGARIAVMQWWAKRQL